MQKRRKSFAWLLFLIVGLVLLLASALVALAFVASQGWLPPEWQWVKDLLDQAERRLGPSVRFLAWLGGIAASLAGAAFTLLASWHFAEMNLPQRIEDLKKAHTRGHLLVQPDILALARNGLGPVRADIEKSRLMLLRKWLSWGEKERARVLAASANQLAREASALSAAAQEAQQQQITAHLIRGYQHASQGEDDKAFEEFEAATKVRDDNIVSRDVAAGWARRINQHKRELELLQEMQQVANNMRSEIDLARALRRRAELLNKNENDLDRIEARNRLNEARDLLLPLVGDKEAKLELGRVVTLFCEVQCNRTAIGHLGGPLARMRGYMVGVAMHTRPEELGGEAYGEERASRVERRVAELRGDVVAEGDDTDNQ